MKQKHLYLLWGGMFILCAGLGFIPEPTALTRLLAAAFFVPGLLLLYRAAGEGDRGGLKLIRGLSGLSLGLTLVLIVANLLSAGRSELLGLMLHCMLVVVSSPMVCGGNWAVSLFLWACLLLTAQRELKKLARRN